MSLCGVKLGISTPCIPTNYCVDSFGCPPDRCPDFIIKRHDVKPSLRIRLDDIEGEALDLTDPNLILEVNMWAKSKLKYNLDNTSNYFALVDNIGFNQILIGDVILFNRVRSPEYVLVIGFDEVNNLVQVERGYNGSVISSWKRGTHLNIFRIMNSPAEIQSVYEDVTKDDGTVLANQLTGTYLSYNWSSSDTCVPGCFWLEFKLLKMSIPMNISVTSNIISNSSDSSDEDYPVGNQVNDYPLGDYESGDSSPETVIVDTQVILPSAISVIIPIENPTPSIDIIPTINTISYISMITPSFTSFSVPTQICSLGNGVEWVRRFPVDDGFLIKIINTPTGE